MTKKEFVTALSEKTGFSRKDTEVFVNAFLDTVTSELAKGNSVNLTGFGCFEVRSRKEKYCLNPQTKEKMLVPATKTPAFKVGKALKEEISK